MAKKPAQPTHKQHVVPQFYLRPFADAKQQLWGYNKATGGSFQVGVKDAAQKHGFFSLPELDGANGAGSFAESYLQRYETPAAVVMRDLIGAMSDGVQCLISDDVRIPLSRFIAVQHQRTLRARSRLVDLNRSLHVVTKHVAEAWPDDLPPEPIPLVSAEDHALLHLKTSLHPGTIAKIARDLQQHVWALFFNRSAFPYYTSDHPVTVQSLVERTNRGVGLRSYGAEVSLPLSPHHLLTLVERRWAEKHIPRYAARDGCIWGAHTAENATYYRSLQVSNSHRFVYSYDRGDFGLANEMCTAHPELRDPDRSIFNAWWGGERIYGSDNQPVDWDALLGR